MMCIVLILERECVETFCSCFVTKTLLEFVVHKMCPYIPLHVPEGWLCSALSPILLENKYLTAPNSYRALNPPSGGNVSREHSYPDFSFQEDDPLAKYLIHAATHMACARTTTLITGCRIVHMTLATADGL